MKTGPQTRQWGLKKDHQPSQRLTSQNAPTLKKLDDTAARTDTKTLQNPKDEGSVDRLAQLDTGCEEQEKTAQTLTTGTCMNRKKKLRLEKRRDKLLERTRNRTRASIPLKDKAN
jgi:hypothetical protein